MADKKKKIINVKRIAIMTAVIAICLFLLGGSTYLMMKWIAERISKAAKQYTHTVSINPDGTFSTGTTAEELWQSMKESGYEIDKYLSGPEELEYLMNAELVTQLPNTAGEDSYYDTVKIYSTSELGRVLESAEKTTANTLRGTNYNNCSGWIYKVFVNAGLKVANPGNGAKGMCRLWCLSSNKNDLKPGMVIAVTSTSNRKFWRCYMGTYRTLYWKQSG